MVSTGPKTKQPPVRFAGVARHIGVCFVVIRSCRSDLADLVARFWRTVSIGWIRLNCPLAISQTPGGTPREGLSVSHCEYGSG
jgi:hypothetical protein